MRDDTFGENDIFRILLRDEFGNAIETNIKLYLCHKIIFMCVSILFEEINKYTLQIFYIQDFKDFETACIKPYASGVLTTFNNQYYLFSAGHTFTEDVNKLGFLKSNGDIAQIDGDIKYINPQKNPEINNLGDVAVVHFSELAVKDLKSAGYSFYSLNEDCLSHHLNPNNVYLIMGYPTTKTKKKWGTGTLEIAPLKLLIKSDKNSNIYKENGFDINRNFIFHFLRTKLLNEKGLRVSAPLPHGISGCGVWYYNKNTSLVLIGIMFEWIENKSIIVGAKLDFSMEIVRQFIDSTVPASSTIYNFES